MSTLQRVWLEPEKMLKIDALRDSTYHKMVAMLKRYGRCHLECVTGFGKTKLFERYIRENTKERVLFITDRKVAVDRMDAYARGYNEHNAAKTYAWLAREVNFEDKLDFISQFTTIIFDEDHLTGKHNCDDVFDMVKDTDIKVVGGSATSLRSDGVNVAYKFFEGRIIEYSMKQAVSEGFIVPPIIISTVYIELRVSELTKKLKGKKGSQWAVEQLTGIERALAKRSGLNTTIENAVLLGGKGVWIVFHPNIEVMKRIAPVLNKAFKQVDSSVSCFMVSSDEEHDDVEDFISKHEGFSVVHSVNMMTTGWHFEDMSGLIMNSITNSPIKSIQQLGRGMVLGSAKSAIVVDIVGRYSSRKEDEIMGVLGYDKVSVKQQKGESEKQTGQVTYIPSYAVDTRDEDIAFDKVLDAIDAWITGAESAMTVDEAIQLRKKFGYTLASMARKTGVPENILTELCEA